MKIDGGKTITMSGDKIYSWHKCRGLDVHYHFEDYATAKRCVTGMGLLSEDEDENEDEDEDPGFPGCRII